MEAIQVAANGWQARPGGDVVEVALESDLPAALQQHLDGSDGLTPDLLQALSTHQLEDAAATDGALDVLTGVHV